MRQLCPGGKKRKKKKKKAGSGPAPCSNPEEHSAAWWGTSKHPGMPPPKKLIQDPHLRSGYSTPIQIQMDSLLRFLIMVVFHCTMCKKHAGSRECAMPVWNNIDPKQEFQQIARLWLLWTIVTKYIYSSTIILRYLSTFNATFYLANLKIFREKYCHCCSYAFISQL